MSSRFKGMFDAVKEEDIPKVKIPKIKKEIKIIDPPALPNQSKRKKGMGKSSNPNYVQALAYIKKETLQNIKIALVLEKDLDFSELIETLLSDWLQNKT
jgi:hypothetical protein